MTPLLITHSINSNEADFILMYKVKEFKKETRSSKTSKKKDTPYTRIITLTFVKESKIEHKIFNIKQSLEGNETPFKLSHVYFKNSIYLAGFGKLIFLIFLMFYMPISLVLSTDFKWFLTNDYHSFSPWLEPLQR